ncbi:hypothetical protein [Massilia brevitalea]|uniref:hypothetical protein n=1 Tax=Massilia brevitalea TaxID=442526 RepID=UPI002739A274|nr:hypothetical protein [Massilia brevitalea]
MANRVYLLGVEQDFFASDEPGLHQLLEAEYCLPVLWLSLFRKDDIRLYQEVPLLLTSREQALANFDARRAALAGFLGGSTDILLGQFRQFIEQNAFANYMVNTYELDMMEDDGVFHEQLQGYMDNLESIVEGRFASRELPLLLQADEELAEYPYTGNAQPLCGFSYDLALPWEARAA